MKHVNDIPVKLNSEMLYFKNTELAESHHVSLRTVLNWIEAAKQGRLDLVLHIENGRAYVANTTRNIAAVEELVEKRRKYRNSRSFKTITPTKEFYKLYNQQQILDIVSNLDIYGEIPRQYNYFNEGAEYWHKYASRLVTEETPNLLTRTQQLLKFNESYIDELLKNYEKVNVIDIGVGNSLPVKNFLSDLLAKGVLGRYIAIDISGKMLQIARQNIHKWFKDSVKFEGYQLDVGYERFPNLLAGEYIQNDRKKIVNLVLLLGGTLSNLRSPDAAFKIIHDSMGREDILFHTLKLDTETSRKYFDFNSNPGATRLAPNHRYILDLLNIDEAFYDVEMGFNESRRERYIQIKLKVALTLQFQFDVGTRDITLNKDDTILLWRALHQSALDVVEQFDRNEFHPLQISQTEDKEYLLTISKIKY